MAPELDVETRERASEQEVIHRYGRERERHRRQYATLPRRPQRRDEYSHGRWVLCVVVLYVFSLVTDLQETVKVLTVVGNRATKAGSITCDIYRDRATARSVSSLHQ